MGRKTGARQLKREPAPGFWPIHRKEATWAPNTHPGPHPIEQSLPLILVIRELLGYVKVAKEGIRAIKSGTVKVDGIVRKDHRFPVGLMDIVQIEKAGKTFRLLPKPNKGLSLLPVDEKEAGYKLCKITDKSTLTKGRTQLNLHDGRNIILDTRPSSQKPGQEYRVGGSIQIGIPDQKLIKYVPFQVGSLGLVVDGRNEGYHGKITAIIPGTHARPKTVKIETSEVAFETPARYVIPVGTDLLLVKLEA
ncbi:MAG TPA: 30S ribosomal protein S4e [Candidatus Bathyarchaeia archaeon]|nr:30S ribosomal protein S4e [Candidatus Bathyarchaeia archaeon]